MNQMKLEPKLIYFSIFKTVGKIQANENITKHSTQIDSLAPLVGNAV